MTSETTNSPSPAFRAHLEWEVTRAFRREARLGARHREHRRRRVRAAMLVAVSLAVGATAGLAPAQVRDAASRDSLLEAARAELALTQLRLQLAQAAFADVMKKAKVGAASSEGVTEAEKELRAMEARLGKAEVSIEEVRATSQAVRDELNAPVVNGRDFVIERLQFDLRGAQQELAAAERTYAAMEARARVGLVTEVASAEAQLEIERSRRALALLAERLDLRREFVQRGTAVDQLSTRLEATGVRLDVLLARKAMELAQLRLKTLENQRMIGAAEELDVMRARLEVKERELELSRLAAQLQRLTRRP